MPYRITNSKGDTQDLGAGFTRKGVSWADRRRRTAKLASLVAGSEVDYRDRRNLSVRTRKAKSPMADWPKCHLCKAHGIPPASYDTQLKEGVTPTCQYCIWKADKRRDKVRAVMRKPLPDLTGRDKQCLRTGTGNG